MYILIRDFADDQIHLIHVNEMGYNDETECMWIDSHNNNNRDIPISQGEYEIIVKKLFAFGRLDLSNTDLRAYYDGDENGD
ncbi:MAG: hypothetical protein ACI4WH_08860 [Oscillospiraceae bacterium]